MKPDIAIIVNGKAGKVRDGYFNQAEIEKILGERAYIVLTNSLEELEAVLSKIKEMAVKFLCIYGGDGTQQKVISSLIDIWGDKEYPIIIPLKGGTMNMLIHDLQLDCKPEKMIYYIKEKFLDTNLEPNDAQTQLKNVVKISIYEIETGKQEHYYGFLASLGMIYRVMYKYCEKPASLRNALRTLLNTVFSLFFNTEWTYIYDRIPMDVENEFYSLKKEMLLGVLVVTIRRLVFGFNPFRQMENRSVEYLDFLAIRTGRKGAWKVLPFIIFGFINRFRKKGIALANNVKQTEISCSSGLLLDGEIINEDGIPRNYKFETGPIIKTLKL